MAIFAVSVSHLHARLKSWQQKIKKNELAGACNHPISKGIFISSFHLSGHLEHCHIIWLYWAVVLLFLSVSCSMLWGSESPFFTTPCSYSEHWPVNEATDLFTVYSLNTAFRVLLQGGANDRPCTLAIVLEHVIVPIKEKCILWQCPGHACWKGPWKYDAKLNSKDDNS